MIGRLLVLAAFVGAVLVAIVVTTHEPEEPFAVAGLLLGVGVAVFGVASLTFYYASRGRRRGASALIALRRGGIVAIGIVALGSLRAIDALSAVTAAFLLAALVALEGVLSARA